MILILLIILLSLFVSLITLPLGYYSPEWILLVLIYWAIAIPSINKLFLAFLLGFLTDIVLGQVLGISSLFYVILIYIVLRLYNSLRYMTIAQQSFVIFFLIIVKQHLLVWAYIIIGKTIEYQAILIGSFMNAFLWPLIFFALRYVRRKFNIG
jgi:rod shape-determining protein MreD